jgi:3'-phosphoadenosine 5'-phosphosulfate sulfotransferase (PAPS reductase)/FAD synthetase
LLKPIFEEERQFIYKKTDILLPKDCWRNGSKIYLDCLADKPVYTIKIVNKEIKIKDTKNNNGNQKTVKELQILYEEVLSRLEQTSVKKTVEYILNHSDYYYVISHSGGKDSVVMYNIWLKALELIKNNNVDIYNDLQWEIIFENTSNDTADTYRYIKNELPKDKLKIANPKIGFYQWIKKIKNYYIPSVTVRNCCSTFKEGQLKKHYDLNENIIMVTGVRKYESAKRANFDYVMDSKFRIENFGIDNLSKKWITFAPIVEWKDEEIWLYILNKKLQFNRQYKLGFNRCGCLICPFQHDYIDLLIEEYYPSLWEKWLGILKKNYEVYNVKERLKWTLEEWQQGYWKQGKSKEYNLISKKPTKERIKELATLKDISENMAEKYFNKKCKCGKKMNPTELAMFYKYYGRYEEMVDDPRELLCKKCFCDDMDIAGKKYNYLAILHLESGCKLF